MPPFYVKSILPDKIFTIDKCKIILFFVFLNSIMRPLFEMSHDCHIHKGDADWKFFYLILTCRSYMLFSVTTTKYSVLLQEKYKPYTFYLVINPFWITTSNLFSVFWHGEEETEKVPRNIVLIRVNVFSFTAPGVKSTNSCSVSKRNYFVR